MARAHWVIVASLFASTASIASAARATPAGPLSSVTSNGQLGDISSLLSPSTVPFLLNTDTGALGDLGGQGGTFVGHTTLSFQTLAQPGGPSISVFDFSSFTIDPGVTLIIAGSKPAALATTGAVTIDGTLNVQAGTIAGAPANSQGTGGGGATGGAGGQAGGAIDVNDVIVGGGGGGGGNGGAGQKGQNGVALGSVPEPRQSAGGAGGATSQSTLLQGGGGGGGGGGVLCCNGFEPGAAGGAGGGALAFVTPASFAVGGTGVISDKGSAGGGGPGGFNGSGGGGGGGTLLFDIAGVFQNAGLIQASGGAGGVTTPNGVASFLGGAGGGGIVDIDPSQFINTGVIDVTDGNGGATNGGVVDVTAPIVPNTGVILGTTLTVTTPAVAVPEPGPLTLIGAGLAALAWLRRRGRDAVRSRKTRLLAFVGVIAALMLTAPCDGRAADNAPPNLAFTSWRDPIEGAFTVNVPRGWAVTGGLRRASQLDPRAAVELHSPDGVLHVALGDFGIGAFEVPDPTRTRMGVREGQTIPAGPNAPMAVTILRYLPGAQFAERYVRQRCGAARILGMLPLPEVSHGLAAGAEAMNAQYHPRIAARAADVAFECGGRQGMVETGTVLASPPGGRGIAMWSVPLLAVYTTGDPAQAELGKAVMNVLIASFHYDPLWERRFNALAASVTGHVIGEQNALLRGVQARASQQASASLNHPNDFTPSSGVVKPADTSGSKTVCTGTGACASVSNDHSYYWMNNAQKFAPGPESGAPPDNGGSWYPAH